MLWWKGNIWREANMIGTGTSISLNDFWVAESDNVLVNFS